MTALLASVRSSEEALDAAQAGADLIDLKEPDAGALGGVHLLAGVGGRRCSEKQCGHAQAEPTSLRVVQHGQKSGRSRRRTGRQGH